MERIAVPDAGAADDAHPAHLGQPFTAPQVEHHRVLTLNNSNPARKPASTDRSTVTR